MDDDTMLNPLIAWSTSILIVLRSIWQPVIQPSSHVGKKSPLKSCSKLHVLRCASVNLGSPLWVLEEKYDGNCLRQREPIHLWKGGVMTGVIDLCDLCQKRGIHCWTCIPDSALGLKDPCVKSHGSIRSLQTMPHPPSFLIAYLVMAKYWRGKKSSFFVAF